jgi:hypothetical protein
VEVVPICAQDMECARIQRLRHALATKAGPDLPVLAGIIFFQARIMMQAQKNKFAVAAVVGALALLAVLAAVLLYIYESCSV